MIYENYHPEIVFLILNFEMPKPTIDAVDNIKSSVQDLDYVILVVDNGSKNSTIEILRSKLTAYERVVLISTGANLGYARGNNYGLKLIRSWWPNCKYVVIMNPDVRLHSQACISTLVQKLEKYQHLATITGIHILDGKLPATSITCTIPSPFEVLVNNFSLMTRIFKPRFVEPFVTEDLLVMSEVISGAFFIAKIDVLEKVGFFDEKTFLYYEEAILACKLKEAGYKQAVDLSFFYFHNHDSSRSSDFSYLRKTLRYMTESRVYYLKRYGKPRSLALSVSMIVRFFYPLRIANLWFRQFFHRIQQ